MSYSDPIGDMITRIRNAQTAAHTVVSVPVSHLREKVLAVLEREGYIAGFKRVESSKGMPTFAVDLKYYNGKPVIVKISRVSKPGRRIYSQISRLPKYYNGLGVSILSTSMGVLSDHEARKLNVGGEVICQVF